MQQKVTPVIGANLVVQNMPFNATVSAVEHDKQTNRTKVFLDWGEHGKSYVWAHDEWDVWFNVARVN